MATPRPKVLRSPAPDDSGRVEYAIRESRRARAVGDATAAQVEVFVQDTSPTEGDEAWVWLQTGVAGSGVSLWFYEPEAT